MQSWALLRSSSTFLKKRVASRAFSCLAAFFIAGGMAIAAPAGPPPLTDSDFKLYESGSEDMRVHALIAFAKAGQQEQAAQGRLQRLLRFLATISYKRGARASARHCAR